MANLLDDLIDEYIASPVKNLKAGVQGALAGTAQGGAQIAETFGRAANAVAGKSVFDGSADTIRSIAQGLAEDADASRASVSEHTRELQRQSTPTGNLFKGELDLGERPTVAGYLNNITEGLGSLAPTVATAVATRGRSLGTQAAAGAGVGGVVGGGAAAQEEGRRIRSMEVGELTALPAYRQALLEGVSPAVARERVARAAETGAFAATAPVSAAGGAATSALFGKPVQSLLAKAGGGKVGASITSGLTGAAEEGAQEVAEGVAQRLGASAATGEQGREVGEESAANLVLGIGAGGPVGAAAGATAPRGTPAPDAPLPASAPGPAAPQSQSPAQAVTVVNPNRGVLSRALAAGAEQGAVAGVAVVDDAVPAGLNAPPLEAMPPTMPPVIPQVAPASAEIGQYQLEASARAADAGQPYIGTWGESPVSIAPNKATLKPAERQVEAKAARQVLADPEAAIAAYEGLKDTDGGRVISVDEAREIFDDYSSGPEGRSANSVSVHEPASFVAKAVWARRLAEEVAPDRDPVVVFTAGGTGAGKTSAVRRDKDAADLMDSADLIYDGNLQNVDSASARIEEALDSGRAVEILYVHRDPVDAFRNGVLPRAAKENYGRTVPIEGHLSTHINAAKTIFQLQDKYRDNPYVNIQILNNAGDAVTDAAADVARVASTDYTALEQEVRNALDQERQAGKLPARVENYYFGGDQGAQRGAPGDAGPQGVFGLDRGQGQSPAPAPQGQAGDVIPAGLNRQPAGSNLRKPGAPMAPVTDYGVIVAPKPGTNIAVDGEVRPYQRGTDTTLPPAAAPVQRAPDLRALQERAHAILKRPPAVAALRKAFGVKGVKLKTIRGSYQGEPELSFHLTAEGLGPDNAAQVAQALGLAFAQDAVIVTKPDPVGPEEDSIPTLELYNTDGTKLADEVFDAVTAELRAQGIDYSEARDGHAIRVLHFGDEASLEALATTMAASATAHGLSVNHLHTRSDLYEAQDYRRNLGEGGDQAVPGLRPEIFRALVDQLVVPYTRAIGGAGYRFDAGRYAARYGLDESEAAYLSAKVAAAEPRSTVALLKGEEPLPARDGRPTNADAGFFLQNRAAAFGEIDANDRSAQALDTLSETFAQEIEYQLSKPDGKQAIGWYDRQLKAALKTVAGLHPEINSDRNAAFVFKALLATTSQNLTVEQNFNVALKLYQRYKDTGRFELAGVTLPGKAAPIAKQNVEKLQGLIDKRGLDGARKFLQGKHTVRDLKEGGYDPSGLLDQSVRGWFVFGPKIGSFGNNLDGDFDTLTADLWFSRTWNRALGSMFQYSPKREVESLRKFRSALVDKLNTGGDPLVDALNDDERARIGELEFDLQLAKALHRQFARNGYKDRSALNAAAKSLTENVEMLRDVPRGDPERRWQQQVMEEVQRKIAERSGQTVSIADLQALLWYQEKELFRLLGAANKASAPLDYQDAAKAAVAQVEGRHLGTKGDGTVVTTAYPLGRDYLLGAIRKIVKDARIVPIAGNEKSVQRVAIDRALEPAEAAKLRKLAGITRVMGGTFPAGPALAETAKVPPRFQVPTSVAQSRHFAALDEDQQATVDAVLGELKRDGFPKAWLQPTYFFAHNADQAFTARFYIDGETKGAVSVRQDQFQYERLQKGGLKRALSHELAHAADFDPDAGGFRSSASPRFALRREGDNVVYTGDIISELAQAHSGGTPLTLELNYPLADAVEYSDDVLKAEVFAQAVLLYYSQKADLKRHAPKTFALIEEITREAAAGPDRAARAVPQALQAGRVRPVNLRAPGLDRREAGGQVDRGEQDRPEIARGLDQRDVAGDRGGVTPALAFEGFTLPSPRLSEHLSDEAGKRLAGYQSAAAAGADKLRTFLQDYFLPVKRVQQAIEARGGTVTEDSDVYGREELYYGRTGEQLRQLEEDHVKPLVAAMTKAGVSQADLELYLYAKFAPARNARIATINPAFPDGGSGMTNADAAQVLADFAQAGTTAKLEALAGRVRAMNKVRLDVLEEGGLLSPGEAELWREEEHYVPLKGVAEGVGHDTVSSRQPTGQGFSIGGKEAHQALGRKSRASDLLANTIAQVEQAIIRAEKNRVAIALLRLAEENPNEALWSVDKLPQKPQLSAAGEVTYREDPLHRLADNVVSVKVAGEQHFVTLHDERLAAAMKNLGAAKMGAFLRAFSSVNRFLSLTRTMLAPEFVLANFARDLQTASINLTGDQSAAMAARVVKDVPVSIRAMYAQLRNKSKGGEWSRWAQEFADEGGMTSFVAQYTVEEQQAKIAGLLKDAQGGSRVAIKKLVRGTFDFIEDVNGAVENATRLSAYANARRAGMSQQQAARLAKNLTVNFNRKGQAGPTINALYLFYNASIQGTARFLRALKSPKVQKIMAATAVLGYTLAAANRAIGGEDDDGEDRWDKIPDWEKARNLILFIPGGDGATIKIPLPYTYNLPFLIGSEVEGMANSKRPPSAAAANIAEAMLTSFSPVGDLDLEGDSATAAAKLVSPTAVDPLVDIATNTNFFGAPINPERSPFDKTPEPDSALAFASTNPAARWLAKTLNSVTGGDELRPGLIDVSPGSMVYVFDYLTGGTGSFVERSATAAMLAAQGEPVPANKVPFLRVFKGELSDRRVTDTFYRLRDDVNMKAERWELSHKTGFDSEGDRLDAMLGRKMAPRLKAAERQLSRIRKRRKEAQLAGDTAATKLFEARERAIQLRFNTAYFNALDAGE